MTEGYCVKCRTTREMVNVVPATMKNGTAANKGNCAECGTGMFRMVGKKRETAAT